MKTKMRYFDKIGMQTGIILIIFLFHNNLSANEPQIVTGETGVVAIAQKQRQGNDSISRKKVLPDSSNKKKTCDANAWKKCNNEKCKGKDKFIDKDGDGINDNRCKGSGFCRQKNRKKCCPGVK